jgi:hypothetical protein
MSLENILTTSDNLALIIDFGMSIRIPYVDNGSGGGLRQRCLIKPDRPCGKVSLLCALQYCFMISYETICILGVLRHFQFVL